VNRPSCDGSSGAVDHRAATTPGGGVEAERSESKVAVVAALLGNAALSTLKGISAAATGSAAMLAETSHSIADTGNEALLLLGMRAAQRPPDERHPFGHGKAVYFWAFVVSVVLFSLGGAFSVWEGVRKLVVIGVILLAVAVVLALENHSLLIGERAQDDVERVIREAVAKDDAVVSIERIRTMHVGPHEIIAMLSVRFREGLTAADVVEAIGRLHSRIETALARDVRPRFVAIEPVGLSRPRRAA
jgi:divalent metal cation (Fe/Co/Zn/Cd) transporter